MLFIFFDQRNLKRTKYNTAITYKSSPSFLYILYSVHTFFLSICSQLLFFLSLSRSLSLSLSLFLSFVKRQNRGVFGTEWPPGAPGETSLCQRVDQGLLVPPGEQLLLLVRAGQGVAAVVGPHVQSGVYRVGEVGGLQGGRAHKEKRDRIKIRPLHSVVLFYFCTPLEDIIFQPSSTFKVKVIGSVKCVWFGGWFKLVSPGPSQAG